MRIVCLLFLSGFTILLAVTSFAQDLPVVNPATESYDEIEYSSIRNLYSIEDLMSAVKSGDEEGFIFDLTNITILNDGSNINPNKIYGNIYAGPYPFEKDEVDYTYKRFRRESDIENGVGKIDVKYLMSGNHNSENWTDRGNLMVRVKLYLQESGMDRNLGVYDFILNFKKKGSFIKQPAIIEGPFISNMNGKNPNEFVIFFKTSKPCKAKVVFDSTVVYEDIAEVKEHEFPFKEATPGANYNYHIEINGIQTKDYTFKAAPDEGATGVVFAYTGDSREGVGAGEREFMGLNYYMLERIANLAYRKDADFFIFGGDLINGYTSSVDDFNTQLYAWKSAMSGFWHTRSVYPAMGNHESLLKVYGNVGERVQLDRWPYNTESAEAVFANNFMNPKNGPDPSDSRRPTYSENLFSFIYGDVKVIAFNNNYWYSNEPSKFGGSPEGYILNDQMNWIREELNKAKNNPNVKYVILFAQEPVIPNGGHIDDAMWWEGNNNITAYTNRAGNLEPEQKGIVDVRNEFVEMVTNYKKVAAVLGSDEHAYYKIRISNDVPLGIPSRDDKDGDGIVCENEEPCSSLNIKYPTWFLTRGGGGAPYYSEEKTPWNTYLKKNRPEDHYYTSQYNMIIFKSSSTVLSAEAYNPYSQMIDKVENLMSHKY